MGQKEKHLEVGNSYACNVGDAEILKNNFIFEMDINFNI